MTAQTRDHRLVIALLGSSTGRTRAETLAVARRHGAKVAALQGTEAPSLVRVLDDLAAEDGRDVEILALSGPDWRVGFSWLRRVAGHWARTRGTVRLRVSDERFRAPSDIDRWAASRSAVRRSSRLVTGREALLTNPAWSRPPAYRHHLLICRGPRCNASGAEATADALTTELARRGMIDDEVLVANTGCLFPCNLAPAVVVHPANTWHGPLRPDDVVAFVDGHLDGSGPQFGGR